ncbi:flavin reductase family protein [Bacillus massiliigorillae]|uniref:flavin reductase family protein n=1 Tax=Bacillus massiliigorillae TaxID=1243664 RepID=UPI0003A2D8A0|nr:flavin reductase family protein [Bacillus massiliigorillae]
MISIDPNDLSERENYKFLIGSIIPRPIAFVTTVASDGTLNAAPFSFFNIVSSNPPLISISVQRKNGKRKDTARNIVETKEFVVHVVDEAIVHQVNETAAMLPANESEIALTNLTVIPSTKVATPGIKEAKVRLECVLERVIELGGDHHNGCDLLIGKVVHYHIAEGLYNQGRIEHEGLGAVSRLAGSNYAKIGEVFSIERPE